MTAAGIRIAALLPHFFIVDFINPGIFKRCREE
jgi:hypothetical protein